MLLRLILCMRRQGQEVSLWAATGASLPAPSQIEALNAQRPSGSAAKVRVATVTTSNRCVTGAQRLTEWRAGSLMPSGIACNLARHISTLIQ